MSVLQPGAHTSKDRPKIVTATSLPLGHMFTNSNGRTCIKTGLSGPEDGLEYNPATNAWVTYNITNAEVVVPVEATFTITGNTQ